MWLRDVVEAFVDGPCPALCRPLFSPCPPPTQPLPCTALLLPAFAGPGTGAFLRCLVLPWPPFPPASLQEETAKKDSEGHWKGIIRDMERNFQDTVKRYVAEIEALKQDREKDLREREQKSKVPPQTLCCHAPPLGGRVPLHWVRQVWSRTRRNRLL